MKRAGRELHKNFCMLDGSPCTRCNKCKHMPVVMNEVKQSNNWLIKFLLAIVIALIALLLLFTIGAVGSGVTHDLLEDTNDYSHTSQKNYKNYEPPVDYYDTGFKVYTYEDNPATCNNGECPKSNFTYY